MMKMKVVVCVTVEYDVIAVKIGCMVLGINVGKLALTIYYMKVLLVKKVSVVYYVCHIDF